MKPPKPCLLAFLVNLCFVSITWGTWEMQISDGFLTSASAPVPGLLLVILNGIFLFFLFRTVDAFRCSDWQALNSSAAAPICSIITRGHSDGSCLIHGDSSCSTLSLAFFYDSFLLPIIPRTRAPRGSYEARGGWGVGGAEVGWHLICSMVVIYWMSVNPDWMKNGAQRRRNVPCSSLGGVRLLTSCLKPPLPPRNS